MNRKPPLLAQLAPERRARAEAEPWVPSEEAKVAISEGYLKVIAMKGGPTIFIDLRAAKEKPEPQGPAVTPQSGREGQ